MISRISIIVLISLAQCVHAQHDSLVVKSSVDHFLQSFTTLQWEPFRKSFTEDATIFFPDWEQASRVNGIKEIEKTWLELFPEFKDSTHQLNLSIIPRNMRIQIYGPMAIVTFQLGSGEKYVSRRTLVMVKRKEEWKITHLHASTLFPENK